MTARPGDVRRHDEVVVRLTTELRAERKLRAEAEKNAARFHALMLQAKVRLVACEKRLA